MSECWLQYLLITFRKVIILSKCLHVPVIDTFVFHEQYSQRYNRIKPDKSCRTCSNSLHWRQIDGTLLLLCCYWHCCYCCCCCCCCCRRRRLCDGAYVVVVVFVYMVFVLRLTFFALFHCFVVGFEIKLLTALKVKLLFCYLKYFRWKD